MPVSSYEQFLGYDWAHYAGQMSKLSAIGCTAIGVITVFLYLKVVSGFLSIISGLIISVWEFPFIFCWLRNFEQLRYYMEENLYLKYEEMKGVILIALSLLCFRIGNILAISGFLLFVTGMFFLFAAINRRADQAERNNLPGGGYPSSSTTFPSVIPMYSPIPNEQSTLPSYPSYPKPITPTTTNPPPYNPQSNNNNNGNFGTF